MKIGVLKESKKNEHRAALLPSGVNVLRNNGHAVFVQSNLGHGIGFEDQHYIEAGAKIIKTTKELINSAELIIKVKEPTIEECGYFKEYHILFTYLHLAAFPQQFQLLKESGCLALAYETVTNKAGKLPLLAPMSEIAGRLAVSLASTYLLKGYEGKGVLLSGAIGVKRGNVVIIGAGIVGSNALSSAVGLGASITILDKNIDRLRELDALYGSKITCLYSSEDNIISSIKGADLIIGAVLIAGAKAPKVITTKMLKYMEKGTVLADVAIDQGGCFEDSKPTTYSNPIYNVEGKIFSCISNLPGGVAKTSTYALTNVTLQYIVELANKGYKQAFLEDQYFAEGINLYKGKVMQKGLADSFNETFYDFKKEFHMKI